METLNFGEYTFNLNTLRLSMHNHRIRLRPKTAVLLRVLLSTRNRISAKRDLIQAVWQSDLVAEQNLFQAMSELRRVLAPLKPIKTFPNRGYQWVAPVTLATQHREAATPRAFSHFGSPARVAAATLGVGVFLFTLLTLGVTGKNYPASLASSKPGLPISLSPALMAFTTGLAQLNTGRVAEAERYFRLSVRENPEFLEAQLLLSETLFRQGRIESARQRALTLINSGKTQHDAYTVMAAMDLISRSDQFSGRNSSAIEWATAAADQAHTQGYVCAAADLDQRLSTLLARLAGEVPFAAESVRSNYSALDQRRLQPVQSYAGAGYADQNKTQSLRCEQMRAPPLESGERRLPTASLPLLATLERALQARPARA